MGKLAGRKRRYFARPHLPADQRADDDACEQRKNKGRGQKVYTNALLAPYRNVHRRPEQSPGYGAVYRTVEHGRTQALFDQKETPVPVRQTHSF